MSPGHVFQTKQKGDASNHMAVLFELCEFFIRIFNFTNLKYWRRTQTLKEKLAVYLTPCGDILTFLTWTM